MHFDPDGSLAQHIRSSMSMIGSDDHSFLNLIAKIALYPIYGPTWEADRLFKDIVEFVRLFTPHGWAPVKRGSVELIRSGLDTYHISGSLDQAERVLVDGWNEGNRIHTALLPLQMLGAREVWVLWPRHRSVTVYAVGATKELGPNDELNGGDVLPGFRVRVGDLFNIDE